MSLVVVPAMRSSEVRRRLSFVLASLSLLLSFTPVRAQHWEIIADLRHLHTFVPYFYNAKYGWLGTSGTGAGASQSDHSAIYKSTDSGLTWKVTSFPQHDSLSVLGFYFISPTHGYAAVEASDDALKDLQGIYETTDGGDTWRVRFQSYGKTLSNTVYVAADGTIFTNGGWFSKNKGATWQQSNPQVSYSSSVTGNKDNIVYLGAGPGNQGYNNQTAYSDNGGQNWSIGPDDHTAWTMYGMPHLSHLFMASEENWNITGNPQWNQSTVYGSSDGGRSWTPLWDSGFGHSRNVSGGSLTGGIAGENCAIYIQENALTVDPDQNGFWRSTDFGQSWQPVGGPACQLDSRFSVTGRGAIVYATDLSGYLFRTSDGGDGLLRNDLRRDIALRIKGLTSSDTLTIPCDSGGLDLVLNFLGCDLSRFDSLHVSGLQPSEYQINVSGHIMPMGPDQTIPISIKTQRAGDYAVTVKFFFTSENTDRVDTTVSFILHAGASAPHLALSVGDTLDLGTASICNPKLTGAFDISNLGCTTLQISGIQFENDGDSSFHFTSPTAFNLEKSDAPSHFVVNFTAKRPGTFRAKLRIMTNVGERDIELVAHVGSNAFSLTQSTEIFSGDICDDMSQIFTFTNTGCGTVIIDSVIHAGLDVHTPLPWVLDPNQFVKLQLTLHTGARTPSIVAKAYIRYVSGKDTTSMQLDWTFAVNESTTKPLIALTTASLDFGDVPLCSSKDTTFAVYTRCIPEDVTAFIISQSTLDFVSTGFTARTLQANDTMYITVHFAPVALGLVQATAVVKTSLGDLPLTINATGVTNNGIAGLSKSVLTFTEIRAHCESSELTTALRNTTCQDISIDSVVTSGAPFRVDNTKYIGVHVTDGAEHDVTVTYTPQLVGAASGTVTIYYTTADGQHHSVTLTVNGTSRNTPEVTAELGAGSYHALAGKTLLVPVIVRTSGVPTDITSVQLTAAHIRFRLNSDVMTLVGAKSRRSDVIVNNTAVVGNVIDLSLSFAAGYPVTPVDTVVDLEFEAFVSDSITTTLSPIDVTYESPTATCLTVKDPDRSIVATLSTDLLCGEDLITGAMQGDLRFERIAPVPARDEVRVDLNRPIAGQCDLLDATGQVLQRSDVNGTSVILAVREIASGTYTIRIATDGVVRYGRLVVVH